MAIEKLKINYKVQR